MAYQFRLYVWFEKFTFRKSFSYRDPFRSNNSRIPDQMRYHWGARALESNIPRRRVRDFRVSKNVFARNICEDEKQTGKRSLKKQ